MEICFGNSALKRTTETGLRMRLDTSWIVKARFLKSDVKSWIVQFDFTDRLDP